MRPITLWRPSWVLMKTKVALTHSGQQYVHSDLTILSFSSKIQDGRHKCRYFKLRNFLFEFEFLLASCKSLIPTFVRTFMKPFGLEHQVSSGNSLLVVDVLFQSFHLIFLFLIFSLGFNSARH